MYDPILERVGLRDVLAEAMQVAMMASTPILLPSGHYTPHCKKGKGHGFKQHARADAKRNARVRHRRPPNY